MNFEKAFAYYMEASKSGVPEDRLVGEIRMGAMLARGEGVKRDVARGRSLVKNAADTGDTTALVTLGDLYSQGDAGPIDAQAAIAAYEKAISLGEVEANVRLGDLYRDGTVVNADPAKAFGLFETAMKAASILGKRRVGEMLALGEGVQQDVELGRRLVAEVAAQGDPAAYLALGTSTAWRCRPRRWGEGPRRLQAGAGPRRHGSSGQAWLSVQQRVGVGARPRQGLRLLPTGRDAGNEVGRIQVGGMIARGQGVPQDVDRGRAIVRAVADTGSTAA